MVRAGKEQIGSQEKDKAQNRAHGKLMAEPRLLTSPY